MADKELWIWATRPYLKETPRESSRKFKGSNTLALNKTNSCQKERLFLLWPSQMTNLEWKMLVAVVLLLTAILQQEDSTSCCSISIGNHFLKVNCNESLVDSCCCSLCFSCKALFTAAQPVFQLCTASVAVKQPILPRHSPFCSGTVCVATAARVYDAAAH